MRAKHRNTRHISIARQLQQLHGSWYAARFLAKRGWSLEAALWVLLKAGAR